MLFGDRTLEVRGSGVGLDEHNNQPFEGSNTHRRGNVARTSRGRGQQHSATTQQSTVGRSNHNQDDDDDDDDDKNKEQVDDDDTTTRF